MLSVPEASLGAIPLQTGAESAAFDTAEDADSESQEGETDPPATKTAVRIRLIVSFCLWWKKEKEG